MGLQLWVQMLSANKSAGFFKMLYIKEEMSDELHFWHADKHRSLLRVDGIILVVSNQTCQKYPKYKKYRNLLSTLMKKSKQAYYDKYFERNWNNIKNTWQAIKSLISLKTEASRVATVFSLDNGDTITSLYDIANTFNNCFASIAVTTKTRLIYSHKHLSDETFK